MKKIILYTISFALMLIGACSDDASGTITGPGLGGGPGTGGGGSLSITISSKQDQQGGYIFSGTPSAAITVSKITVSVPAENYTESLQYDGVTVVNANTTEDFIQYDPNSGVTQGQQWTFQFEGTLAADGKAYNVTSNYTIP
ncbi:MAG: hypothetical protein KDC52_02130 [Ignavibacteriae bacterium]|nr:hypothetical protein [Ignavibacteriota bacterium]MCB0748162.1 hypothetical protein [Ignavibacteriota bacterium]MCB0750252.1 hypothetical protein [Ignavibacteriota bacterium]MCB9248512.1 hypothetical protein [Ignavibacteriales bacterium]